MSEAKAGAADTAKASAPKTAARGCEERVMRFPKVLRLRIGRRLQTAPMRIMTPAGRPRKLGRSPKTVLGLRGARPTSPAHTVARTITHGARVGAPSDIWRLSRYLLARR